ncbi:helix-turn-helix domain-containing protein [Novosphingobium clariflavum]|uniref:Helix-turn-helix domain-containing protein n=1 Tax=Novosphingobium clariflavum TaxID=2029884 RepID=A0ABV6SEE4_9SPHN|nr:helix-turn-helix domain-containing protein [Novosphingobium clariflavum]
MLPPLHPEDIKSKLRQRYGTIGKFERLKGLPYRMVSQLLIGKASMRAAEAVADELDIPVHRVNSHYAELYYNLSTTPRHRRKQDQVHRLSDKVA